MYVQEYICYIRLIILSLPLSLPLITGSPHSSLVAKISLSSKRLMTLMHLDFVHVFADLLSEEEEEGEGEEDGERDFRCVTLTLRVGTTCSSVAKYTEKERRVKRKRSNNEKNREKINAI